MRTFKDTRGKCWYDIVPKLDGQIDIAINYPGTIRAFHYHKKRTEWLFAIQGDFKVVLKNKKDKEEFFITQGEMVKVKPHVWVGYQVLGKEIGIMLQVCDIKYDLSKPDNLREKFDAFDTWEIEKK